MVAVSAGGLATPKRGFRVYDSYGADFFTIQSPFALSGIDYHWSGRQIIEPGTNFFMLTLDNGWSIRVSGYQLVLP